MSARRTINPLASTEQQALPAAATWEDPGQPTTPSTPPASYTVPVVRFQMVRESALTAPAVRCAADAAALFRRHLGEPDREHFIALALSTKHEPLALHIVSIGGLASAPVHPREVFAFAVAYHAAALIVAHNHPSGNPEPSRDDVAITEQLKAAGLVLGIELLDHVILGTRNFTSLREQRRAFP